MDSISESKVSIETMYKDRMIIVSNAVEKSCKACTEMLPLFRERNRSITSFRGAVSVLCPRRYALHASVVHASGSGQLQANPHVAGPWLSPGKPTRRAVATMGSNDLVVGEDHMLGPSCQRYNWQTGRCGSIVFGSSPRRGITLISNPRCLADVSTCGKDFRR